MRFCRARATRHGERKNVKLRGNDKYVLCFQLKLTAVIWFFFPSPKPKSDVRSLKRESTSVGKKGTKHQEEHATSLAVGEWLKFIFMLLKSGLWVIEGIKDGKSSGVFIASTCVRKWDLISCGLLFNYARWLKGKLWYLSSYRFWHAIHLLLTRPSSFLTGEPAPKSCTTLRCVKLWSGNWAAVQFNPLRCSLLSAYVDRFLCEINAHVQPQFQSARMMINNSQPLPPFQHPFSINK